MLNACNDLLGLDESKSIRVQLGLGRLGVGRGLLGETLPTLGALTIFGRCWRGDSAGLFLGVAEIGAGVVADADIAVESCRE